MQCFALYAADPGAADDRLESFSADSQGAVHCPVMSTDSGSPVAVDTSTQKGILKRQIFNERQL